MIVITDSKENCFSSISSLLRSNLILFFSTSSFFFHINLVLGRFWHKIHVHVVQWGAEYRQRWTRWSWNKFDILYDISKSFFSKRCLSLCCTWWRIYIQYTLVIYFNNFIVLFWLWMAEIIIGGKCRVNRGSLAQNRFNFVKVFDFFTDNRLETLFPIRFPDTLTNCTYPIVCGLEFAY